MKMELWVVMAPFELKLLVSEANRTDQPFRTIPDSISSHMGSKSIENPKKTWFNRRPTTPWYSAERRQWETQGQGFQYLGGNKQKVWKLRMRNQGSKLHGSIILRFYRGGTWALKPGERWRVDGESMESDEEVWQNFEPTNQPPIPQESMHFN